MSPPPIWGLFLLAAHNAGYGRYAEHHERNRFDSDRPALRRQQRTTQSHSKVGGCVRETFLPPRFEAAYCWIDSA